MKKQELKVGILFSLTGTTSITEIGQYQACLLAIRHINDRGGINGKMLIPIVEDAGSDPEITYQKAEKMVIRDQVTAIIGCYTAACRKSVIPILEKHNILLFYPTINEGGEQHPNIFYSNSTPNQQLIDFIPWLLHNVGTSFYLLGSDYIYPREINKIIRRLVQENGGSIYGEHYVPLGSQYFHKQLNEIRSTNPDIIFSTLVGDSTINYYQQHEELGLPQAIASNVTGETEIEAINPNGKIDYYSCFSYFNSIDTAQNRKFLMEFKRLYGTDTVSSVMESAYNSVFLLAEALKKSSSPKTESIRQALAGLSFEAPQGKIMVDHINQHVWLNSRIGKVNAAGQFTIIWESDQIISPIPFLEIESSSRNNQENMVLTGENLENKIILHLPFFSELNENLKRHPILISYFDLITDAFEGLTNGQQDSLLIIKNGEICYLNQNALMLKKRKAKLVESVLQELTFEIGNKTEWILRRDDKEESFEINIKRKNSLYFVYFKSLPRPLHRYSFNKRSNITTYDLIGSNELFLKSVQLARTAANIQANTLLLGESGTGKELFARAIHNESPRKHKPFIAVNCAAIPKELINSELFGYVDGAFTGAKKGGSPGKFEIANGGTLFLDEIGDMPIELQSSLLRTLQEKEVVRIGGHQSIPLDVRIIAATNKNLSQEIAFNGSFRSDLFYRLNVFTIELAPLRLRIDDISALCSYYLYEFKGLTGQEKVLSKETLSILKQYNWPGNIRELCNAIERASYLSGPSVIILPEHLPQEIIEYSKRPVLNQNDSFNLSIKSIHDIKEINYETERDFYLNALMNNRGNISKTAKELGISRTTLYKKLKDYQIQT
ncbi:transporter substrate-binding protein [Neobacillus mesonae]|uniref:Sigma-54-dependent Fis family transcriptional regulator n=1 Tax=Neobacillus mesonae TaxID=1193713 RepID=A0A3Q9QU15_9BACI|nr:transporter substrate-binding protein [Neobacillus mesonae]AZU62246.1 sigma-54-dependent Fis family transcriptional regulator [Neobacillus mesonae]